MDKWSLALLKVASGGAVQEWSCWRKLPWASVGLLLSRQDLSGGIFAGAGAVLLPFLHMSLLCSPCLWQTRSRNACWGSLIFVQLCGPLWSSVRRSYFAVFRGGNAHCNADAWKEGCKETSLSPSVIVWAANHKAFSDKYLYCSDYCFWMLLAPLVWKNWVHNDLNSCR